MAPQLSLIAATIAAAVNLFSWWMLSRKKPDARRYRAEPQARLLVGHFALFYVGAFGWLIFGDVDQGTWSRTLIWMAPLAFLGPWTIDALAAAVYVAGRRKALDDDFTPSGPPLASSETFDDL